MSEHDLARALARGMWTAATAGSRPGSKNMMPWAEALLEARTWLQKEHASNGGATREPDCLTCQMLAKLDDLASGKVTL